MVKTAKIVIGANYGDEGKGLTTAHFALQAQKANRHCLNILFNGGPQRGHTVETASLFRHVFHHFGSSTIYGSDTFFDKTFMVNPMSFVDEYEKLLSKGMTPHSFTHPLCRVTTIYDMLINQIVETIRNHNKHGSCGYGIWETQRRYEDSKFNFSFQQLTALSDNEIKNYLYDIRTVYLPDRLRFYNIEEKDIPTDYIVLLTDEMAEQMDEHYVSDLRYMASVSPCKPFHVLVDKYSYFIYEGAQGLALDADNAPMKPYVTASKTGASFPVERIKPYTNDIEIIYVTRSYFTRHGTGPFPTECPKEHLSIPYVDKTNQPNDWQDSIRYGWFDGKEMDERINMDLASIPDKENTTVSYMITHWDMKDEKMDEWMKLHKPHNLYISTTPFPDTVTMLNTEYTNKYSISSA